VVEGPMRLRGRGNNSDGGGALSWIVASVSKRWASQGAV
jgi:hypothetical protein